MALSDEDTQRISSALENMTVTTSIVTNALLTDVLLRCNAVDVQEAGKAFMVASQLACILSMLNVYVATLPPTALTYLQAHVNSISKNEDNGILTEAGLQSLIDLLTPFRPVMSSMPTA